MQIFQSSQEYIREMPIVRKLIDVLEDDDIFILTVSDETYEEYKIFEETCKEKENTISVPNFYKIQPDYPKEKFERPDHYIVYSYRNQNVIEEEIEIDQNFLNLISNYIEEDEIKKILIFLEDNYDFDAIEGKTKHTLYINFPYISIELLNQIHNYWNQKTMEKKKSLLRKYWRKHKLSDKFVLNTFNRRKNNKVRTRNSNKQLITLISKLKEKKTELEENVLQLLKGVILRESLKKSYLNVELFDYYCLKSCYYNRSVINSLKFFKRLSKRTKKALTHKKKIEISLNSNLENNYMK